MGVGRVTRGSVRRNQQVVVVDRQGNQRKAKIMTVYGYSGLEKVERTQASAGDIICITGGGRLGYIRYIVRPRRRRRTAPAYCRRAHFVDDVLRQQFAAVWQRG